MRAKGERSWLKSMTATSIDSRLKSASAALLALTAPNRQEISTFQSQPFGSKVKFKNTDRVFEISIPPKGFYFGLILTTSLAVFWNGITLLFLVASLPTFSNGGWGILFFISPFVWIGIILIWEILFALVGTRKLRIDESEISVSEAIFGVRCFTSRTAPRQYLDRLEIVPLTYAKDADGTRVLVPRYINIWAGNQKFCLDKFNLTQPEQEWFVRELTNWLNLHNLDKAAKKERKKFPPLSNINISSNKLEP